MIQKRPKNSAIQELFAKRLRALLFNDPSGVPPWLETVSGGEGPGLFQPGDAPWVIHADFGTFVGGVRALLMQALHPGSLAGVHQHSRYKSDPLGRLAGTIRWLTITTFASHEAVAAEAARINKMHSRVRGDYQSAGGETVSYRASDPHLLLWVHIAFMDSFLRCHQLFATAEIPGGADAYVRLWAKSVEPLGLSEVPTTEAELIATLDQFQSELAVTDETREVIRWLRNPPLPVASLPVYELLFQAALASLPAYCRDLLALKGVPLPIIRPVTRGLLKCMRLAIGPENVLSDSAVVRLERWKAMGHGSPE
jgi:uncharacterized protein (DUF2236 family)